jgi:hypothetical protein
MSDAVTFTKLTPYSVDDSGRLVLDEHRSVALVDQSTETLVAAIKTFAYPLYCVDRGDRTDAEVQYLGPFRTHGEALGLAERVDLVRRCRQLRPSEIAFDRDALSLGEFESFDALVDDLDEAATSGNLPEGAWYRVGKRIVFDKFNDGTLPTAADFDTWINDRLILDAWICEGDE